MSDLISNNEPLVTVYILNYNYAAYLKGCIDSVLMQSYGNCEIFVIDDGSTDKSKEILSEYVGDDRLSVVFQENIGLIKSIFKAFSMANGKYIVRVDADDWIAPNFIEKLVAGIDDDESIAMVFPDYYEVDESGHLLHRIKRHDFSTDVTLLDQPAHGACTLTRKSAYFDVGGHNQQLQCQDGVDIWLALTEKYKVANLKEPLFYYRKHSRSLTTNHDKILRNRSMIYRDHAVRRGYEAESVLAFIPVREELIGESEFALQDIAGKSLLQWCVEKAVHSGLVTDIVVSTDSGRVEDHIHMHPDLYAKNNIKVHKRSKTLASQGVHINESIRDYFDMYQYDFDGSVVILTPNYPFSTNIHIDTAIYCGYIFDSDVVDSVIEDSSILYYHNGNGLVELFDGEIRHERDNVYIRKGGITVCRNSYLSGVQSGKKHEKVVRGHIVVDEYSSFEVKTISDMRIANYMANNILGLSYD